MKAEQLQKKKSSIIIDHSLDQYETMVLFPKKLAKANEMLTRIGVGKVKKQLNKKSV